MSGKKLAGNAELEKLQHDSFSYFVQEANPSNGLVLDKTEVDWPASIAATGLALAAYPAGVEHRGGALELARLAQQFERRSASPLPDRT